jgi:hypothetical protein
MGVVPRSDVAYNAVHGYGDDPVRNEYESN